MRYPLVEVLLRCLLGLLAGCESRVAIAEFGEKTLEFRRRFRPFRVGTPSHDPLGAICAALDGSQVQHGFIAWVASLAGLGADIVAVDGRTFWRSYRKGGAKAPAVMISATGSRPYDLGSRVGTWCSARPRWRRSRMRSSPSRACRICWRSLERS